MTANAELNNLLLRFWRNAQLPNTLWQVAIIAVALGIAWWFSRYVQNRSTVSNSRYEGGFRLSGRRVSFLLFPIVAFCIVLLAWAILRRFQPVNLLSLALPLIGSLALVRVGVSAARIAFRRHAWVVALEKVFAVLVWFVLALHILGWLPEIVEALDDITWVFGKNKITLWQALKALALVCVTVLVAMWLAGLVERRLNYTSGLNGNLRLVLVRVTKAILIVLALVICLPLVGIDLTMLSVFGGALGVGLGLGLQKIAANYVSGFIILLDRSLALGSLISVGDQRGVVTNISTRYTVLKALNGVEAIVPNEILVNSVVINETFSDSRVVIPIRFQVSYRTDLEKAVRVLEEEGRANPRTLLDPAPKGFVVSFDDSGITLQLSIWIGDPQEGSLGVISEINLAVWRRFQSENIEFPFPQREVRILGDRSGLSPPTSIVQPSAQT